jgi:hypothetical protein
MENFNQINQALNEIDGNVPPAPLQKSVRSQE